MRGLAAQLYTYICRIRPGNVQSNGNSAFLRTKEELTLEEQAERKVGWILKLIFAGTATAVGYHLFPYMGDNLIQQSVSLLQVKDPLFKRMGASRISRFAVDDERRLKILEMGGAEELVKMLDTAKDDRTRKEALKAISALSASDTPSWSNISDQVCSRPCRGSRHHYLQGKFTEKVSRFEIQLKRWTLTAYIFITESIHLRYLRVDASNRMQMRQIPI